MKLRLASFSSSNCNKVFSVIGSYGTKDFVADANTTEFFNVANPQYANLTQQQVSGNGSTTTLGQALASGQAATTIINGASPAVLLGANFFSSANSTYQGNVLLHAYTGWNDSEIFAKFANYGLTNPNQDTEDISAWLSTDCKSTPSSVTWLSWRLCQAFSVAPSLRKAVAKHLLRK